VFILRHDETETFAGGAANAASNIASLGAKVSIIGLVGDDENGRKLLDRLDRNGVDRTFVVAAPGFRTTTKVRVLAGQHYAARQQVIRIDYENSQDTDAAAANDIKVNLERAAETADAIVVSDYNYGAANPVIGQLAVSIGRRRGIPVIVDSRFRLQAFSGATSATPNQDEVEQILGSDFTEFDCAALCKELGFDALLMTRGNQGMLLAQSGHEPQSIDSIGSKEPVDVTGAGDTVIAVYALGLACGLGFRDSARLANHAGGIVVMKKGTATVGPDELLKSLRNNQTKSLSHDAD
jgi:rfaE bifunctional protein kinase chain/domain